MKQVSQASPGADPAILSCLEFGLPEIRVELIDLQRYNVQIVSMALCSLYSV